MGQMRKRAALCRMQLERVKALVDNPEGQELEPLVSPVPRVPPEGTSPAEASAAMPTSFPHAEESGAQGPQTLQEGLGSPETFVEYRDDPTAGSTLSTHAPTSVPQGRLGPPSGSLSQPKTGDNGELLVSVPQGAPGVGKAVTRQRDPLCDQSQVVAPQISATGAGVPMGSPGGASPRRHCPSNGAGAHIDSTAGGSEVPESPEASPGDRTEEPMCGATAQAVVEGNSSGRRLKGVPTAGAIHLRGS